MRDESSTSRSATGKELWASERADTSRSRCDREAGYRSSTSRSSPFEVQSVTTSRTPGKGSTSPGAFRRSVCVRERSNGVSDGASRRLDRESGSEPRRGIGVSGSDCPNVTRCFIAEIGREAGVAPRPGNFPLPSHHDT